MIRTFLALLVVTFGLSLQERAVAGRPAPAPKPLFIPWTIAAEDEGVESVVGHHAGLGFLDGVEVGFGFGLPVLGSDAPAQFSWLFAGSLGPMSLGLGYSLFPDPQGIAALTHRLDIGYALRLSHSWSVAFGWHGFYSNVSAQLDRYESWSLSTTVRPLRWLSVAVGFDRINTPRYNAQTVPAAGRISIAMRPASERLSLGIDAAADIADPVGWSVGGSLRGMPIDGLVLGAYARYASGGVDERLVPVEGINRLEFGAYLGISQSAIESLLGVDISRTVGSSADTTATFNALIKAGTVRRTSLVAPSRQVVGLRLSGPLPERVTTGLLGGLLTPSAGTPFAYWLAALDVVQRDPNVSALLLRLDGAPNWAQCWELREAIGRIRQAGKKVLVFFANGDMRTLYLASAADKVFMHPTGVLMVQGLSVTRSYYGDLLANLGVNAQFVKYEAFKSAPETFTDSGPSAPAKQQTRDLLAAFEALWGGAVRSGRKLGPKELERAVEAGPLTAELAKKHGLVDGIVADDALPKAMEDALGFPAVVVSRYRPSPSAWARWTASRKVAVVPVTGAIVDGTSSEAFPIELPFVGGETTGERTFIPALMSAARDPSVLGIVVRVDSGGGAVLASDKMYRAINKAAKAKPLVVSFGNIAASGGYYLAAGAPRILGSPATVTGSIGIYSGKVDLSGLYRRVGVATHTERTHPAADAMGLHRPWTEAEIERARQRLKAYYDQFVDIVAKGRKLNPEAARNRAGGRVFDGAKALSLNLLDGHGGLWDAINEVRVRAGAQSEAFSIVYLPVDDSFLASLTRLFSGLFGASSEPSRPRLPGVLERLAAQLLRMKPAGVYAQMPYVLEVQ